MRNIIKHIVSILFGISIMLNISLGYLLWSERCKQSGVVTTVVHSEEQTSFPPDPIKKPKQSIQNKTSQLDTRSFHKYPYLEQQHREVIETVIRTHHPNAIVYDWWIKKYEDYYLHVSVITNYDPRSGEYDGHTLQIYAP